MEPLTFSAVRPISISGSTEISSATSVTGRPIAGRTIRAAKVRSSRARTVRIEGPSDLDVYADGDPIGRLPVTVTVHREAVRILAG